MTDSHLQNENGKFLPVLAIDGRFYPREFQKDIIRGIASVGLRRDDLYLCGYPRSGHHWVFEIMSMILSGSAEYIPHTMERCVLELNSAPSLAALPSPRILASHVLPGNMPRDHNGSVRTVYVMRDPRDVAVSWFNFYSAYPGDPWSGSWDDWFDLFIGDEFMWSSWWEHVRSFEKLLASMDTDLAHIVFYEELKENPLKVVRDLSTFLHRPIEVEKLQEIVDKCSFRSMKSVKDNLNINWDGKKAQYRKGIVGDWKNVFTQSQAEKFHQVYSEKMAGSAYYKRYLDV